MGSPQGFLDTLVSKGRFSLRILLWIQTLPTSGKMGISLSARFDLGPWTVHGTRGG